MATDRSARGHIIIHACAVAAATWAAATAFVPVAGPLLAGSTGLAAITVIMVFNLAALFDKKLETTAIWAFVVHLLGLTLSSSLLNAFASLVPVFGSAVNAAVTFALIEGIGWGLFFIFQEGKDPLRLADSELRRYVAKGRTFSEEAKKTGRFAWLNDLPPHVKVQYDHLTTRLASSDLTDEERQGVLQQIEHLLAPYAP